MPKLKLKDFSRDSRKATPTIYPVGAILKLSKGIREARKTAVKNVIVEANGSCKGCLFSDTYCSDYLNVRCTVGDGTGVGVIFTPCLPSGEPL